MLCACECGEVLTGRQRSYASIECGKKEARRKRLWTTYNITLEDYDIILAFQNGVCFICGEPPKPGDVLHVDHDHPTGLVMGLLHFKCNKFVKGRLVIPQLIRLGEYGQNPPAVLALGREVIAPPPTKKKRRAKRKKSG